MIIGKATEENAAAVMQLFTAILNDSEATVALSILCNALAYQGAARNAPKEEFIGIVTEMLDKIYTAQTQATNIQTQ